jgi:hypothetical protein
MDNQVVGAWMDEVLRIFVLGIEWFALWLERSLLHVAWPVLYVVLFQVFLSIVHVFQWYARGMLLRVACDYPITTSKGSDPCKNKTLGEWHRCHQHRHRWQRLTDGHVVDPRPAAVADDWARRRPHGTPRPLRRGDNSCPIPLDRLALSPRLCTPAVGGEAAGA